MPVNPERGDYTVLFGNPAVGVTITQGTGAPAFIAPKASLYLRQDGGAGTCMYVNEDGTGSGWVAK